MTLQKPVKARELSISLIGEQITKRINGMTNSRRRSTTTERFRIYDFKQELDIEKEYINNGLYHFGIKIPDDILENKPQNANPEGLLEQRLKLAQAAAMVAGSVPMQRYQWYLLAKLDVPGGLDIRKKVDLTIC
jgi:hypothetical protein